MQHLSRLRREPVKHRAAVIGLFGLFLLWRLCLMALSVDPMSHDPQDSYTLQALAWRAGHMYIVDNLFSHNLELAIYKGQMFVSFPPVPSLPLWVLTFVYGWATPNRIVNLFYFLSSYLVGYSICRRLGKADTPSAVWAAFLVSGCNLLNLCWFGGVWYQAQALSFLFTLCTFRLLLCKAPAALCAGLAALALAVGCRPFQAAYIPPALWMVYSRLQKSKKTSFLNAIVRIIPLCVPALAIGVGYGLYNLARFDSFFEFGHTYLPEFQTYGPQFSLSYLPQNLQHIFRLPWMEGERLNFPRCSGFAFYLANPLFVITILTFVLAIRRRRVRTLDILLAGSIALHFFLLLLHRTFGGWQFGTRYLIDLCPALYYLTVRHPLKQRIAVGLLMLLGVLFNLYGGLLFHLT